MLEYSEIILQLHSSRERAFATKFYIERKPEYEVMKELYIDSKQTMWRLKRRVRLIIEKTYGNKFE